MTEKASAEEKIAKINTFIFDEMGFRFPPHSLYAKEIDLYTFLPSVLDSRRGVCLGVSFLYLCLAQRLGLTLEMITPPGHIYVRFRSNDTLVNIETTARGIHIDSEEYLGVNCRDLQQRTIKEVIGMSHFNQASLFWQKGEYAKALQAYRKAEPYMKEDLQLKELMGYTLILTGEHKEGEKLLQEVQLHVPSYAIVKNSMAEDYLRGLADAEAIAAIFTHVDEDRKSLLNKKNQLEQVVERCPLFRSGLLSLASIWFQLHRAGEALEVLKQFEAIDKKDPEIHYYLSILYYQRRDYTKAWNHLQLTEAILKPHQHYPKELKDHRRELLRTSPE